MASVIAVCGLNGAGKSTLGAVLAESLGYVFIDIEDLYFPKNDPEYMYSDPRPFAEVERLLGEILSHGGGYVLSAVRCNFKKEVISQIKCAVYLEVPKEIRLMRVYERSYRKFGERMKEGGDLYEKEKSFFEHVKSRDEKTVLDWLSNVTCPVIVTDGTRPIDESVNYIKEKLKTIL